MYWSYLLVPLYAVLLCPRCHFPSMYVFPVLIELLRRYVPSTTDVCDDLNAVSFSRGRHVACDSRSVPFTEDDRFGS